MHAQSSSKTMPAFFILLAALYRMGFSRCSRNGVSSCAFSKFPLMKMEVHWLLENDAGQLYLTGAALRRMRCCGRHHHAQSFIKSQKSTPSSAASQNCGACESGGVLVKICRERRPPFRRWQSFAINHSRLWWVCKANVNAWMNSGLPDLTATLLNIPGRSF